MIKAANRNTAIITAKDQMMVLAKEMSVLLEQMEDVEYIAIMRPQGKEGSIYYALKV